LDNDGQQERADALFLRRLSIGLGVFRLYPDKPSPSFHSSVERVTESARDVLATGRFEVEVRGRTLVTRGGSLSGDDLFERLALACYERRVERLVVNEVPDTNDLIRLYRLLTMSPDEVERVGGGGPALREWGVSSIMLGTLQPHGPGASTGTATGFPQEQLELWERLRDPAALAAHLLSTAAGQGEEADAGIVLREMEALATRMSEDVVGELNLYDRLHDVIAQLPPELRRKVLSLLMERLDQGDALAQRLVGMMSNAELARALVDLAREGHDPIELARRLSEGPAGRAHLTDLTAALMHGHEEAGTIMAGTKAVAALGDRVWERSASVLETVSDLLARDLKALESEDLRALHQEFSASEGPAAVGGHALQDYLCLEPSLDRLRDVLSVWRKEARDALRRLDETRLEELLAPIEAARRLSTDPGRSELFHAAMRGVIEASLAAELSTPGVNENQVRRLLIRFGPAGAEGLFDLLAEEPQRASRTRLLALLRSLPPSYHSGLAARLGDPRWYVVRNAVHVLARSGGHEVLRLLTQASRHSAAPVRREAIQGLVAAGGDEAIPTILERAEQDPEEAVRAVAVVALGGLLSPGAVDALVAMVRRASTMRLRRLALDQLAVHPSTEAVEALKHLASERSRPRLARILRVRAEAAAKQRVEAA